MQAPAMTPPPQPPRSGPPPGPPAALTPRIAAALTGVLISAMMSGLNSRLGGLALADVRGGLGLGIDEASWFSVCYSAGELMVMPFATWFSITLTVRRFYLIALWTTAGIGLLTPFVINLPTLLVLRTLQGVSAGALIPILMMMALRFLPMAIRLHGLALYALTATFAPNIAIWIAGFWTDIVVLPNGLWWQFVPAAVICTGLVGWGLPKEPVVWPRFATLNWPALITGAPGLFMIALGIGQGNRLDWFDSPLVSFCLLAGGLCLLAYGAFEWSHPAPFIRLQLLARRNLQIGFSAFVVILTIFYSGAGLPAGLLAQTQGYRPLQSAPLGLIIGLPQLLFGSLVALLLYRKWVDARKVFATGLLCVGTACFLAAGLDATWTWQQFLPMQILQAIGQPMTVVSMLFLSTSVVQPMEGPFVAGLVNTLRAFATLLGVALIGHFEELRAAGHSMHLVERWGLVRNLLPHPPGAAEAASLINEQAAVLAVADAYRLLGALAFLLVPYAALFRFIPAPTLPSPPSAEPVKS